MKFDLVSFVIGFATAGLAFALLYRFRERLRAARDWILDALGGARERLTSGSDLRYRQDVVAAWQTAHLAGSMLALDEIYVAPRFWADVPPFEPGKEEEPDITHVIPSSADWPQLSAQYQSPGYTLRDLTRAAHNLLIVGRRGVGKSVLLAHLGVRAASRDEDLFPEAVLPVIIHVGDLELPVAERSDPVQVAIDTAGAQLGTITGPAFPRLFRNALRQGQVLLLLDGYEDLPPAHQALVAEWLKNVRAAYKDCRIIATGPTSGYAPLLALDFVPVVLGGWSAEDYRQLIDRWVSAWEAMLAERKRRRKKEDEIDPALVAGWLLGGTVGRTPLDVTLKLWTGLAGDAEGPRAADWLEAYVKRMSIAPEARKALERAASEMLSRDRYGLPRERLVDLITASRAETPNPSTMDPQDVVDELARRGGLLVRRAGSRYSFSHPEVAGYLGARGIIVHERPNAIDNVHQDPTWAVALRFYAALSNAGGIAAQRLNTPPDALNADLFAVAEWLSDAPASAPWRGDVFRRLAQIFINANLPMHLRARATCALVLSRDESVGKLFKQSLASSDPLTRQYAAAALGAMGDSSAVADIKKLLADADLYVRWAAALALALIGDQAAMDALGQALLEGDERLRQAVCQALILNRTEGYALLKEALRYTDVVVRRGAVAGLERIGAQPWVLELLDQTFADDDQWIVRTAAENAAKELRSPRERCPQPMQAPDQTGWLVAYQATKGQGVPAGPASRQVLLQVLREGDEPARMAAADYLGRTAAGDAVPLLAAAARDSSRGVREMAYRALANIALSTGQRTAL